MSVHFCVSICICIIIFLDTTCAFTKSALCNNCNSLLFPSLSSPSWARCAALWPFHLLMPMRARYVHILRAPFLYKHSHAPPPPHPITPFPSNSKALACLGHDSRVGGFWAHDVMIYVLASLPECVVAWAVKAQHVGIRARALRKKERETKEK